MNSEEFEKVYKNSHSNYASMLSHKIPICQETEFQRKEGKMKQAETSYTTQVLRKQKFGSALTIPLGRQQSLTLHLEISLPTEDALFPS